MIEDHKPIKPCPFCGNDEADVVQTENGEHCVTCGGDSCDAMGRGRSSIRESIIAWNAREGAT